LTAEFLYTEFTLFDYLQESSSTFLILKIYALTLQGKSLYRPPIGVGGLRKEMPVMLRL